MLGGVREKQIFERVSDCDPAPPEQENEQLRSKVETLVGGAPSTQAARGARAVPASLPRIKSATKAAGAKKSMAPPRAAAPSAAKTRGKPKQFKVLRRAVVRAGLERTIMAQEIKFCNRAA